MNAEYYDKHFKVIVMNELCLELIRLYFYAHITDFTSPTCKSFTSKANKIL